MGDAAKEELAKKLFGAKDTTTVADSSAAPKNAAQKTKESVKGAVNNLLKKGERYHLKRINFLYG